VNVDLDQLKRYDERITELAVAYGLDCFPQEFEICDHNEMLAYMAYSGMPSRYPHWSYGKSFEKMKTLYDHGAQGLPYEMVINCNPSLAYLMGDNSLCLNVLTIAHVYGHNDFFKNNFTFSTTRPEFTLSSFKSHAERVRTYVEDPSIGLERVEYILDAAHAISMQCQRNLAVRKLSEGEQRDRAFDAALPRHDPNRTIHKSREYLEPDLRRIPVEPEENLLLFIRDYNPFLMDWERDLLTIVHEEAQYFIPQMETKIMNEGWASYWHYQIMTNLDLPPELRLEFMVHHNQVLSPHPGGLNPYHLGFTIWEHIYRGFEGPETPDHRNNTAGREAIFQARESERDSSFLRRFLDGPLCQRLGLFEFSTNKNEYVVTEIADEQGWQQIRDALVATVGMGSIPVIKIVDGDHEGKRNMRLIHSDDGRELEMEQTEKTLGYTFRLWGRAVSLDTTLAGKPMRLTYDEEGFSAIELEN
jgi:stage V sporulation protein R